MLSKILSFIIAYIKAFVVIGDLSTFIFAFVW